MDDIFRVQAAAVAFGELSGSRQVLIVTPVGLNGRGGIDRLNLYLHTFLDQRGDAKKLAFIGSRGEWPGPIWALTFIAALLKFAWACVSGRHDVVHIHVSTNGSALRKVAFARIARFFHMPYVIQFHGMMCSEYEQKRPMWFRALGTLARGAERVIVLGEAYRAPFERLGVNSARIAIIHNGIPDIGATAAIPRPATDAVKILFSGEVGERKGAHILIEALRQLEPVNPAWTCTMAGNGDVEGMRQAALAAGIGDKVTFTGWVDIGRVHELMREADIVVLPSRAEALPLALIEGASAGAALIASDVGAVRDVVVDGVNGLIAQREPEAIAAALARIAGDLPLRQSMQIASRDIYRERFQVSKFVGAVLNCYAHSRKK